MLVQTTEVTEPRLKELLAVCGSPNVVNEK